MNDKSLNVTNRFFIAGLVLVSSTFIIELNMPHVLASVGYVIIVFFILQFPQNNRYAIVFGIVTTLFIVLGYILTASFYKNEPSVPLNRALSVLAIWLAVYFSHRFRRMIDDEVRGKEQLNAIFNNATEGMLIMNKLGEIILINSFAERLFGYGHSELIGTKIESLLPARFHSSHRIQRLQFMDYPKSRPMGSGRELFAIRKDGTEFPVEISLGHFTNQEGTFAIAFIIDLSEKDQSLKAIVQQQKLAHTYFELAPVLFVTLDLRGIILGINEYGAQHLGYQKEEVLGKNWFKEFLNPDIEQDVFGYFLSMVEGANNKMEYENTVLNKNGTELEISWRNSVIRDLNGNIISVLAAGTDITERKKQERITIAHHTQIQNLNDQLEVKIRKRTIDLNQALTELTEANHELTKKERLFKSIAHYFPDGVIGVLNKDMKYIFADGEEMHNIGLLKSDNVGERVFDSIHPALSDQAEEKLKEVFKGSRIDYDITLNNLTYSISSVPLPDENGVINEIIIVIKNITQQKKTELNLYRSIEKERELSDMKSKFVTMASHEFRTPLSTILSSVFLLESYMGTDLENNKANHLGKIRKSVNNLTALLNDFIQLGKLEEGRVKVNLEPVQVRIYLEELVPELELVRKGDQSIHCEYSGEETSILLDKQLLRSILINLISNAIKYSSMDAGIKATADLTDKELIIKVVDTGIGIPADEQRHIFKRFYRAHNATNIEGTGLGLNIVKKYVRLMKGKIEFQSKLDIGTTFIVTLPRIQNA